MNSQLLAHMETFDSDEEYSDDPELCENYDLVHLDPIEASRLTAKKKGRKFVKPKNVNDILLKVLAMAPVAIALGCHIGFVLSLSLSLITLIWLQLRPPLMKETLQRRASRRRSSVDSWRKPSRNRNSIGSLSRERSNSFLSKSSSQHSQECKPTNGPAVFLDTLEITKQQVHDCRKETSRLLGLIGAPPLEWKSLDNSQAMLSRKHESDTSLAGDVTGASAQLINDLSLRSVIKFLEAHVQFLLTVDHAYYWLKVSASLHWGLGPHSHCVERIERAALAKEFRTNRRQSISGALIAEGIRSPLEPHRKLDTSSILSLASTRRHLAQFLVDQSKTLVNACERVKAWEREKIQSSISDAFETIVSGPIGISSVVDDRILCFPDVVDLSWIKASRKHLGILLTHTVDYFCTIVGLQVLSIAQDKRSILEESMMNARNAREYLLCNLLLGKTPSVKPPVDGTGKSVVDDLLLSLLQFRDQLEGVSAALWSFQQYSNLRTTSPSNVVVPSAADILQQEEEADACKLAWWNQVKDLSAICHSLEREIETKFIPTTLVEPKSNGLNDTTTSVLFDDHLEMESGNYEVEGVVEIEASLQTHTTPQKTMVFAGKGAIEKKTSADVTGGRTREGKATEYASLQERDTVSAQLLVKELQNRISSMAQCEEGGSVLETEDVEGASIDKESMDRELDSILEEFERIDSLEVGLNEKENAKDRYSGVTSGSEGQGQPVVPKPVFVGDVQEKESPISLFLGASGSLLVELKHTLEKSEVHAAHSTISGSEEEKIEEGNYNDKENL